MSDLSVYFDEIVRVDVGSAEKDDEIQTLRCFL